MTKKMVEITDTQERIILEVLELVNSNLTYDDQDKNYKENANDFILTLSRSDKRSLKKGIEALWKCWPVK